MEEGNTEEEAARADAGVPELEAEVTASADEEGAVLDGGAGVGVGERGRYGGADDGAFEVTAPLTARCLPSNQGASRGCLGQVKKNVAPRPSAESTHARPPRVSTIFWTTDSPMPVPSTRSRASSVWKMPQMRW